MAIKKQEFYEGAAIYLLARAGGIEGIAYEAPFFVINGRMLVYLKYSTKGRSPWSFSFSAEEQAGLLRKSGRREIMLGLVCGSDGIAAFSYGAFRSVAAPRDSSVHIACFRRHGEHYEVKGPDGALDGKIAPSGWQKILDL